MNNETVLITGASSGIGLALAREFAQHGHPLVITASVAAELREVAVDVGRSFGVSVRTIVKDMELPTAAGEIYAELAADRVPVEILVNNAGIGQRGKFWETPLDLDVAMLRINIEAMVRLTKLFLPVMVARGHGRVLNTASVAGFEPGPMLAVYHATKAFVLSFSEAIATELEDTSVTVTALCPGPIDTEFAKPEMIDTQVFQRGKEAAPQEIARAAYTSLMAGERVIVPGGVARSIAFSQRPPAGPMQAGDRRGHENDSAKRKRERGDAETKEPKENREGKGRGDKGTRGKD